MTPGTHADLVARLLQKLREWGDGDETDNAVIAAFEADALAALPPPADPPLCEHCQQPMVCPAGTAELIAGLESMHDETLTRAEAAEAKLSETGPQLATPTHVEIDHDGDLSIDFDRANDRVVSLTIYQDGRVGYSALVDGKSAHGIVTAAEPMPSWVRDAIAAPPVPETPQREMPPSSTWGDIGPQPKGWPDGNNAVQWKPKPDCVIGVYCQRHGFIHGQEAEELRERLEELGNKSVNRVLDEVDARDSLAYLEATNEPTPPDAVPPQEGR